MFLFKITHFIFSQCNMNKDKNLLNKLQEINNILLEDYGDFEDIGVLTGSTGVALFHFYYSKLMQEEANATIGSEIIVDAIEKINAGYNVPTFCSGIAGAAWAIQLLQEEDFIDLDTDDLLSGLDGFLDKSLQIDDQYNYYDFLHGAIGIGYYFLKRYENTDALQLKTNYKNALLKIISRLKDMAQIDNNAAKWESNLVFNEKLRGYNLSLSHGISSIINFFSRLSEHEDFKKITFLLLQQSVNYVTKYYNSNTKSSSCFPDWITIDDKKSESARLAWCYGDLGIAISLWRAAKILKDQGVSDMSLAVLKRSAIRRDVEEARIMDAGLCHGSYGVMHIYSYMYKETNNPLFKETAEYWMQKSIEMATHSNGLAGYCQWYGGPQSGWRKETNLLEGIAGIGLALISYVAPFKTKWDECLMIG